MNKLEAFKKVARLAGRAAGFAGSDDKARALEAEKELLELKLLIAKQALEEARDRMTMIGPLADLGGALHEVKEALEVIGRVE